MTAYGSFCDDFFVDMYVNTKLDLPENRDTILAFFERIEKQYPEMRTFLRRSRENYCLKDQEGGGEYRWVSMDRDRVGAGTANPTDLQVAYNLHRFILELVPYMLSVSYLDIDSVELVYGMDFDYSGNHDEVISEALFAGSAFSGIMDITGSRVIQCSPSMVLALTDDQRCQARLTVESKTGYFDPAEAAEESEEAISLSFSLRQYPVPGERFDSIAAYQNLCRLGEELMYDKIINGFARPLNNVIAQKKMD